MQIARCILGFVFAAFFVHAFLHPVLCAHADAKPPSAFGASEGTGAPSAFAPPVASPLRAKGPFAAVLGWVADQQQTMQRELAMGVKRLKDGNAVAAGFTLAALSFLYGVIHAVGPGHGKAIISSYVIANEQTVKRGVLISFAAAAVQATMAVLLVSVLLIALNATGLEITAWANQLETLSYALIALLGLYLVATHAARIWWRRGAGAEERARAHRDHRHAHGHAHEHAHAHIHACAHEHVHDEACGHIVDARQLAGPFSWRKALAVVLSVGVRPCTGAILVLVFALTQGLFWAGVAATFAMAFGTALTVAALATLALGSRELALKIGNGNHAWTEAVWNLCALGGAFVILLFGALMFAASMSGPLRPF
jgi:ABC-type nickel/cobalt efflux system permease component RcnA